MEDHNHSIIDPREYTKEELEHEKSCADLNNVVGELLCTTYPGYPWGIQSNVNNGVINIFLMFGHGGRAPFGVTVKIDTHLRGVLQKCALYAGELLERYKLRRGAMDADEFGALMESRDFAGRVKIDES
ncbi:MAG: hypothetical protein K0U41_00440 [Gammaproteobacteria bacterium]|nr:hypothetical protein [Gammaproteobacteria bacterium]